MLWLVFVLLPILFTVLAYIAAARRLTRGAVVLFAIFAAGLECVIYGVVLGSWSLFNLVAACLLSILAPWLAAVAFAWHVPLRRGERTWVAAVPVVYAMVLVAGVAVGDTAGWVPQ